MPNQTMPVSDFTLCASDNFTLAATLFEPPTSNGRSLIINSAMGVKRRYYTNYAQYMQAKGFTVLTYDYRGVGDSRPATLRGFKASLWEWGVKDADAAITWMTSNHPELKMLMVGHSIGGQILGLCEHNALVSGFLGVGCQSGYWRGWPHWHKLWVSALWYVVIPATCGVLDYFPGSKLGAGEDIPAGVALEWAQAGRRPGYLLDLHGGTSNDHYAQVHAPMRMYSIADDRYAPPPTVKALLPFYHNAQQDYRCVSPQDVGVTRIGHFGFFRRQFESTLWLESAEWLAEI